MRDLSRMVPPALTALLIASVAVPARAIEFGLPAQCTVGVDCFFQQFPDMQPGPGVSDPFCGTATYDGHDGADLRVLSMEDVSRGVPVVAMADGTVLRLRDGVPDRLVTTEADRQAVADRECGNGLVVDHGESYEVQYCHLREGSIVAKPGQSVRRGEKLGNVGASGLAAFPHVHVTVRKEGKIVDPATGRSPDQGCASTRGDMRSLFEQSVAETLDRGEADLVAFGLAGGPVDHAALSVSGPPASASAKSPALVAWGWFINMKEGDRIRFHITDPASNEIVDQTTEPVDRSKASFAAFAGKRGSPPAGTYKVSVALVRAGAVVLEKSDVRSIR